MIQLRDGVVGWLFSEENGWGEYEPLFVEGLGWLIYSVVDSAGSILLWVTKEKLEKPPMDDEEWEKAKEQSLGLFKMLYYGMFGNSAGEGTLYWNDIDGLFTEKENFATYEDGFNLLGKKFVELTKK